MCSITLEVFLFSFRVTRCNTNTKIQKIQDDKEFIPCGKEQQWPCFHRSPVCSTSPWTATFPAWQTCARHCGRWCWAITAPCSGTRSMTNRRPHPQVRDYTCVTECIYIQTQYAFCSERAVSCTNTFIVSVQLQNAPQPTEAAVTVYVHKLVFGASNSSSYFYLNCEKPLCVTCCLGQGSTLNLLIKH